MLNATAQIKSADGGLTPHKALRTAWVIWLTLLVIPFFLFLYIVWKFSDAGTQERGAVGDGGVAWFVVSAIYMLAVVPMSFFWRNVLFQSYWSGHPVHPNKYLTG